MADDPSTPPPRGPLPGWAPPPHAVGQSRFSLGVVVAALLVGIAAGAIIAGVVVLVSGDVLSRFGSHPVVGEHAEIAEDADTPKLGDCLSSQPALADLTTTDEVVPCKRLHKAEVVGVAEFPTLTVRPRDSQIDDYTSEACALSFRDYAGRDPDTTRYDFGAVVPDDKAWAAGDRRFWCLVDSRSEGTGVGSLRR
ncbi:septum formation family protein [Aquihabitans sp. G128]|uniref:septum formation family protein n=1 Tax=Aquihabitans sp. G128 TaxID=2849779 RepID=UPI001C2191D6|nr:septum formation family protein [Aquihabitans sp. G128]QXC61149.1 septum formation family protein [Aquihabitans sp. G128]